MDGIPWPAITAASGGWALFGWLAWRVLSKLTDGTLHTDREMQARDAEVADLRQSNKHLQEQNTELTSGLRASNDVLSALRRVVEERNKP